MDEQGLGYAHAVDEVDIVYLDEIGASVGPIWSGRGP